MCSRQPVIHDDAPLVVRRVNSRRQGDAGIGVAIAWFTTNEFVVSVPLTDSQPYDLVADDGTGPARVWVRTTTRTGPPPGRYYVCNLRTISGLGRGLGMGKVSPFRPDLVDLVFIACGDGSLFLIPAQAIRASTCIQLGLRRWGRYRVRWGGNTTANASAAAV